MLLYFKHGTRDSVNNNMFTDGPKKSDEKKKKKTMITDKIFIEPRKTFIETER